MDSCAGADLPSQPQPAEGLQAAGIDGSGHRHSPRGSDRFLESTPQERALYDAVEDFISSQYAQATGQKKSAVGFVMTIYRRRLASSVAALVSTLEKRLAGQQQQLEEDAAAAEDDDISGEQTFDLEGMQGAFQEPSRQGELEAIGVLLDQARPLVGHDSKGAEFLKAIEQLQAQGFKQVIVFSQYTDTVDALKELLISAGRTNLMAFTGRGGEILQKGGVWKALNREATKRGFKGRQSRDPALHRCRSRRPELPVLRCPDQLRHAVEPHACGAAHRPYRPHWPDP